MNVSNDPLIRTKTEDIELQKGGSMIVNYDHRSWWHAFWIFVDWHTWMLVNK